ncbi:MAG: hypothetical protein KAJ19_06270 [Gammaproteobacteria bacterium]|nr:hypothetical protein [Gammaproteobacteria bacterium]
MDKEKRTFWIIVAVGIIAALLAAGSAGTGLSQEEYNVVGTSNPGTGINYQGMLTDSGGNPLDGTYEMTFRLYEVPSGGTALDTDTHSVEVENGLFNTEIDFDQSYFDGRALWLGITVGADAEMTPRQELRPVPYALSLVPGARIVGNTPDALRIENKGDHAVYGLASNSGDVRNYGGFFVADGSRGRGVYGKASNTGDYVNYGGFFYASGTEGRGVFGQATGSKGIGVKGWASDEGLVDNYGGHFTASGNGGIGVYGVGGSCGVYGETKTYGYGLYTPNNLYVGTDIKVGGGCVMEGPLTIHDAFYVGEGGVYPFRVTESGFVLVGGNMETFGNFEAWNGIYAEAGTNDYAGDFRGGVYAEAGPSDYAAEFQGKVLITGRDTGNPVMELGEGLDYAEGFDVSDENKIVPGTVLIIDPDNHGKLTISDTPYDTKVAGIVAGANGMGSGVRLGADQFDYDVALAGRVYCNVDATEAGVEPGDLLTTSATPGYAMKATDYERAQGAILGKAMERLEKGENGQILVLVTLQ